MPPHQYVFMVCMAPFDVCKEDSRSVQVPSVGKYSNKLFTEHVGSVTVTVLEISGKRKL